MTVIRSSHYHQYDTYWSFDDPDQGRLRYREDEFLDEAGAVTGARARLTLTGPHARGSVRLGAAARARATSRRRRTRARFYREYFRPAAERDRREGSAPLAGGVPRRRVLRAPRSADEARAPTGYFIEVKSRTWSRRDARDKAAIITELLALFGASPDDTISDGYVDLAAGA